MLSYYGTRLLPRILMQDLFKNILELCHNFAFVAWAGFIFIFVWYGFVWFHTLPRLCSEFSMLTVV